MPASGPSQPPVSIQPEPNQNSVPTSGGIPGLSSQTASLELENQGILPKIPCQPIGYR